MNAPGGKHGYGGYSGPVNFGHGEQRDGYATKVGIVLFALFIFYNLMFTLDYLQMAFDL